MESAAAKNPNIYQIGGIPVEFPYKPYGSQLAFMGRVISTLDRAQRQGHCHALLESPTGTGKSLSLLCSALAWQRHYRSKLQNPNPNSNPNPNPSHPIATPVPAPDPYLSGGGFVPEPDPSGNLEQSAPATNKRTKKLNKIPTIYYATRTHSQISQVIREYRKTSYRVPMAVLASRKHYCTNKHVCMKENVDEECKLLLKGHTDQDVRCSEFKNVPKIKDHHSLKEGGCHEAYDIEDLVRIGRLVKGCSYFAAHDMAKEAQLVFCPYNYIINPVIRRAMEIDLKGAIVILDEAHNIEDIARDAVSLDVEEEALDILQKELGELCLIDRVEIYQPLHDMIQGIISWMGQRKNNLRKHEFEHYFSCWTGDNALRELQEAGISHEYFPILQECATKAIEAASDAEKESPHLSSMATVTLDGLFSTLSYFFSENGIHAIDYQLALQRFVKRDAGYAACGLTHSLSLWCLNPAVAFKEIANLSLSVILTSGTLSPMNSFTSELGVQFEACMEAPHVIDVESQLWAAVISTGPGNCQLNASYKTADGYAFQDSLGASLEEICKIVPGGALVFFPSYKLLEKLRSRWVQTGQWFRLNAQKTIFVEPRGNQDEFEPVLKGYYDSIRGNNRTASQGIAPWKLRKGNKRDIKCLSARESLQGSVNGASFFAVCRGKASEGIDFSDENARVVIIVGIPFPKQNDMKVVLKKKYNDTFRSSKNLLSGSTWYCHQAFRALNQAAGRCIRHRFDYGAIIFIDERFKEERNTAYISKWLRKSIKQYDNFDTSLEGLKTFFLGVKERFSKKCIDVEDSCLENSNINKESAPSSKQNILSKGTRKRDQKTKNLEKHNGRKVVSDDMMPTAKTGKLTQYVAAVKNNDTSLSQLQSQGNLMPVASVPTDEEDISDCGEHVEPGFSSQKDCRLSETEHTVFSNRSPDQFVVKEKLATCNNNKTPRTTFKNEISHSTTVQSSSPFSYQQSFHSISVTNSTGVLSGGACISAVTPERKVTGHEHDSPLNLSVNSHSQKSRKPIQTDPSVSLHAESSHVHHIRSTSESWDMIQGTELCFEADCSKCKRQKLNVRRLTSMDNCSTLSMHSELLVDQKLYIFCSACQNPLGLPENHFLVMCSPTSSSKNYLASLLKCGIESQDRNELPSISVLISDTSSVDQRLCKGRFVEGTPQCGVWCEEDGCVFRTVLCPFCTGYETCLGVQTMATDSSNIQLLDKIIFYVDRLIIKNHEAAAKEKDLYTMNGSNPTDQVSDLTTIEKYSYIPELSNSGGWITKKTKLRLPKRSYL